MAAQRNHAYDVKWVLVNKKKRLCRQKKKTEKQYLSGIYYVPGIMPIRVKIK